MKRNAQKKRRETGDNRWKAPIERKESSILSTILHSVYRPILLLTMEPMCLNLCIFSAILLGILYLFFGAFQLVFDEIYGFSLWQRGCSFLGILVGMLAMILTDPLWRRNYNRLERKGMKKEGNTGYQPEWRLPPGKSFFQQLLESFVLIARSYYGCPIGHNWTIYLCLDHISECSLDRTNHREWCIWSRVTLPEIC